MSRLANVLSDCTQCVSEMRLSPMLTKSLRGDMARGRHEVKIESAKDLAQKGDGDE
jgi:hypothetical protein